MKMGTWFKLRRAMRLCLVFIYILLMPWVVMVFVIRLFQGYMSYKEAVSLAAGLDVVLVLVFGLIFLMQACDL